MNDIDTVPKTLQAIYRNLVVSCQAFPGDPLEDDATLLRLTQTAVRAGAAGLRLNGANLVRAVRRETCLPIIAIEKVHRAGHMRITPTFAAAAALAAAGADIIALDCTDRPHVHGEPWQELVERIHSELGVLVMADIATLEEGIAAAAAGADLIGTTLNGYTSATQHGASFDWELLSALKEKIARPIVAEGHIGTPADAKRAIEEGAWCVVAGTAITRPGAITKVFLDAVRSAAKKPTPTFAIGIDIGGTTIKSAIIAGDGEILSPVRIPTEASLGRDAIAASMKQAIQKSIEASKEAGVSPIGIGVATAGVVDAKSGSVLAATENLPGWSGFDIRNYVSREFGLPVFVENDAHAAALSELHLGAGKGLRNFIAITLGTGIGGGIVIDGRLHRGQWGFAGSVGHHSIRTDGRECNCGRRGCLETYVSSKALVREYADLSRDTGRGGTDSAQATHIAHLASVGDGTARDAYGRLARYLAEGLANLFNIVDPQAIILSGGLMEGAPFFVDEVQQRTRELLHFPDVRPPVILCAKAGPYAGIQGAAYAVFEGLSDG